MGQGEMDQGLAARGQVRVVLTQASGPPAPRERPLPHPSLRQDLDALLIGSLVDDREGDAGLFGRPLLQMSCVPASGADVLPAREAPAPAVEPGGGPVSILSPR